MFCCPHRSPPPEAGLGKPRAEWLRIEIHMARKPSPSNARDVVTLADLAPRTRIVGGSERRVFGSNPLGPQEDNMAWKKDLPPKKSVKGGRIAV